MIGVAHMSLRRLSEVATFAGALLLLAGPAWAPGSLPLAEVLEAVRSEAELVRQIEVELRRRDLKVGEIACIAARHGNEWGHLGGGRAAPYECVFGDRTLTIEAERTYFDVNGRKLGHASENVLFNKAKSFRESRFRWSWNP